MGNSLSLIEQVNWLQSMLGRCLLKAEEQGFDEAVQSIEPRRAEIKKIVAVLLGQAFQDWIDESHPLVAQIRTAQEALRKTAETVDTQVAFVRSVVEIMGKVDQIITQVRKYCQI